MKAIHRLRTLAQALTTRWRPALPYRVQHRCPLERHGSWYGGWTLCPTGLSSGSIVYSLGVGEDISFDRSVLEAYGARVYAFDPTPRSRRWLDEQRLPAGFHFVPCAVSNRDGAAPFHPPADPRHVSHSLHRRAAPDAPSLVVPTRRLVTIMEELGHDRIDLLKMDVEGAEHDVIDDMLACGLEVGQLLVEFHHRFAGGSLRRTVRTLDALNRHGYVIVAVSPRGEEVTLLRRR